MGTEDRSEEVLTSSAFAQWRGRLSDRPKSTFNVSKVRRDAEGFAVLSSEPSGIIEEQVDVDGVRGLWLTPQTALRQDSVVLFLHGGGFVSGSIASHRKLAGHIAVACSSSVLLIDYRRAPEHPFPAALDDSMTAYLWILKHYPKATTYLCADSAGGALALGLLLDLRNSAVRTARRVALMSPWLDIGRFKDRESDYGEDPLLDPKVLAQMADAYVGDGDINDPRLSPLEANLEGLPDMFIQVGRDELLRTDAYALVDRALPAGTAVTIELCPMMTHVFQMGVGTFPEADEAIKRIGSWLRDG